jgi:hypothetical protein
MFKLLASIVFAITWISMIQVEPADALPDVIYLGKLDCIHDFIKKKKKVYHIIIEFPLK